MPASCPPISLAFNGAVAIATLDRPPVNAIDDAWVVRLSEILDDIEAREAVTVLWLRATGRAFCAGADLGLMRERFETPEGRAKMVALTRDMQAVFARIERSPKVSVAEIHGAAMGGGLELALACDIRLVADTARVGLPEARLGLLPGAGGTQRLTRICGDALARRLILGAEVLSGAQAAALGVVDQCVPASELEAAARAQVERIAGLPGDALAACKRCILAALDHRDNGFEVEIEGTAKLLATPQTQHLVRQFLAK